MKYILALFLLVVSAYADIPTDIPNIPTHEIGFSITNNPDSHLVIDCYWDPISPKTNSSFE